MGGMGGPTGAQPEFEPLVFGLHPDWTVVVGHHAEEQMGERNVSGSMLRETLRSPDACYPSSQQHRTNIVRKFGEKKVRIVAKEYPKDRKLFLVTVVVHEEGSASYEG